jgi:adenylate cyclase
MERRLAAILAADVVGYSRLMEQDESDTLATLKARRKEVIEPLVAQYQGRIFKFTGDGVLVEFGSAVNAVQCAIDLQHGMATANANTAEARHMVLRIGVNLGDIMVEADDLYGDGVNIAARLEGIADPGGIVLSGTAFDHIKNKVRGGFEDLGTQTLKNIAEPVRVYRIAGTPRVAIPASKGATDRPSIAVLPFTNMSGDPEQAYFSDGITEDILTELSRFRALSVIARNSSFRFRGEDVDVVRVGRELNVQHVLEGSVRKIGDKIRITAQLIDATNGSHMWAERFDRPQDEIFTVQDEVVRIIVGTLAGRLQAVDVAKALRKPPASLAAYDCVLRADAFPVADLIRRTRAPMPNSRFHVSTIGHATTAAPTAP